MSPQELSGLKGLHLQKPLLTASKSCFKRPKSAETSQKKSNPQSRRSQNEAARSEQSSCGVAVVTWGNPGTPSHSRKAACQTEPVEPSQVVVVTPSSGHSGVC